MNNIMNRKANVTNNKIMRHVKYKDMIVLKIDIEYPTITLFNETYVQMKINSIFYNIANQFFINALYTLLPSAIEQYEYEVKEGYPFNPYEAVMKYNTTLNDNCTLSTYFDQYEYTGGAHGNTLRLSNTLNLQNGNIINLEDLFRNNQNYIENILNYINIQAKQNTIDNPGIYFDNYPELIIQNFNKNNFYLTGEAVNIYYQQYEIAPYSTGIVVFELPYKNLGIKGPYCI